MSLDDRIAEARARAERTLDPADWAVVRALEGVQTAERYRPPQPASTDGIPDWPVSALRIPRPKRET